MSLFKLYCQFNQKKKPVYEKLVDIKYIQSISPLYFGLNVDINSTKYAEYEKRVQKIFSKNKVEAFFVTDLKFEQLIEHANDLNIIIKNTKFDFKPDNYSHFENHLFNQDISNKEMLEYVNEFKEQGAKIKSLTILLEEEKTSNISLYDNGWLHLSHDELAKSQFFKVFLEYILTGRMIR